MPQAYGDRHDEAGARRRRQEVRTWGESGALLDAGAFHPGRSGGAHLAALAASNDIPGARVEQVLRIVGPSDAATRRVGSHSLGMRQRLVLQRHLAERVAAAFVVAQAGLVLAASSPA